MKAAWIRTLLVAGVLSIGASGQSPGLQITEPGPGTIVTGALRLQASITTPAAVDVVTFFVDGRSVCSMKQPPFGCTWEAGDTVRPHHVRAVATLSDGNRLVDNVHTRDIGYSENVRTEAVLVPVIVTERGRFVRGLKSNDFEIFEDDVPQPVESFVSEEAPLDLVLAIDISGSMERSLPQVKAAVRQLLTKLRAGDAATILGFNETTFIAAEREKDPKAREEAVELLTSWGGTALYDATVQAVKMVSRQPGRKGLILFSDGDDKDSLTKRDVAMARVQASDAMLFTVGFGTGATVPALRGNLESYARATGGRAFFPRKTEDVGGAFDEIVEDLSNQYVLSYAPKNPKQDGAWRKIKVRVRKGQYDVRARLGYRASGPQRAGR